MKNFTLIFFVMMIFVMYDPATAFAAFALNQRDSIFLTDSGGDVGSTTPYAGAATSTTLTGVPLGVRLVTRIQIDNSGDVSATSTFRLQWENNTDAAGTWNDLGTSTEIGWGLSSRAAPSARYGSVPLASRTVTTACNASSTYVPGSFVAGSGTSTAISIDPAKCTELAYVVDTTGAQLSKTYRLRLVQGSTTVALTSYANYPTFSTVSSMNDIIRVTKEARGVATSSTLEDITNAVGAYSSMAIGIDGLPVIAHQDTTASALKFLRCLDPSCATFTSKTLEDVTNAVGAYASIAIGTDGYPVIAYQDATVGAVKFLKCGDLSCTSTTTTVVDDAANTLGVYASLAIGSDGNPVISHQNSVAGNLNVLKCKNTSCTSTSSVSGFAEGYYTSITNGLDGYPIVAHEKASITAGLRLLKCESVSCSVNNAVSPGSGFEFRNMSIVLSTDGNPFIAYRNNGNSSLEVMKCNNPSCTTSSITVIEDTANSLANSISVALGTDGYPVIAYDDGTIGALKFVKCGNGSCSSFTTQVLEDITNVVGSYVSLVIGTDGNPVISYQNGSVGGLKFYRCSSVDCNPASSSTSNMTGTTTDLSLKLDNSGYTNISASDDVYDQVNGGTTTMIAYQIAEAHANNTDPIVVTWEGQLSVSTTTYLQVFDNTLGAWVGFATNTSPTANADFVLSTTLTSNLSRYYTGGSNTVYVRAVAATTTRATTMKTDQFTATLSSSPTMTQYGYRWRNDDGTEAQATYASTENSSLSGVLYVGDRVRLRVLISNTGFGSASNITYRLEYSSSSCSSWVAVPAYDAVSSLEWFTDLSQWVPDGAVTTDSSGLTNPGGKSFVSGQQKLSTNQTTAHTLTTSEFSEFEFAMRPTSQALTGVTYCFRLSNAGSTTNFSYSVQPQAILRSGQRSTAGGLSVEAYGGGSAHGGGASSGGGGAGGEGSGGGSSHGGGGAGGGGGGVL